MSWDRRTSKQQETARSTALRSQVVDAVGPFSPFWRQRLKALGKKASQVATVEAVAALPAVGERDVCPDGDPAGAAALVLQAGEAGWALHAEGPRLRRAMLGRLARRGSYSAVVEADTRPTTFVFAGQALRWPVASTRRDLDLVARVGARMWQVLGLSREDVLVCALPLLPTASLQALQLGALGAGAPALFPGAAPDDVAAALRLVPTTVLAVPTDVAGALIDDLDEAGAPLSQVRAVLLVGAPTETERGQVAEALTRAGSRAELLVLHVADGHRLPWAQCRKAGTGLHTSPDLELVQLVDPETGEPSRGAGEVVLTQLGLRGSALLRWRTGDLAEGIQTGTCPGCGRTVPRVLGLRRGALVPQLALRTGARGVDLRGVAGALVGRADVADWRVQVGPSPRDGADELLVHVIPSNGTEPTDLVVAVARDVRQAAGLLPTQVVLAEPGELPSGEQITRRLLRR